MRWLISLPTWGERCLETSITATIPSVRAAIDALGRPGHEFGWLVHTDDAGAIGEALEGFDVEFRNVPRGKHNFESFIAAHKEAVAEAPVGGNLVLLNGDLVLSIETFACAQEVFDEGFCALATVGLRTLPQGNPPIGADARTLSEWSWANRHPIAEESIWGSGRSRLLTVLFFVEGGNVVEFAWHLCPLVIRRDRRNLTFRSTIDDDLLIRFAEHEIFVVQNLECAVAEISPHDKQFGKGARPTSEDDFVSYWSRHGRSRHAWNARHAILVAGDRDKVDTSFMNRFLALPAMQKE